MPHAASNTSKQIIFWVGRAARIAATLFLQCPSLHESICMNRFIYSESIQAKGLLYFSLNFNTVDLSGRSAPWNIRPNNQHNPPQSTNPTSHRRHRSDLAKQNGLNLQEMKRRILFQAVESGIFQPVGQERASLSELSMSQGTLCSSAAAAS